MGRGMAARRRRDDTAAWDAETFVVACALEQEEQGGRLDAENARLREDLREVEGWYRLLQADHATLQGRMAESGRRMTALQAESNRLAAENQDLHALVARSAPDQERRPGYVSGKENSMIRVADFLRSARRHRWAAAALATIATLLARDPTVRDVFASAADRVRQAVGHEAGEGRATADSGFLRYAAMIQSREQVDRARREYNENEGRLKGDALLEAQDHLRAARARDRQARLAFLPELARQCERAGMPLPREAAEALAALDRETAD